MTEPVEIEYELNCLKTYQLFVEMVRAKNPARFEPVDLSELPKGMPEHRAQFIQVFRTEQIRIYNSHLELLETCISILNRVHTVKSMSPSLSIA
jgi:hypothetical protein